MRLGILVQRHAFQRCLPSLLHAAYAGSSAARVGDDATAREVDDVSCFGCRIYFGRRTGPLGRRDGWHGPVVAEHWAQAIDDGLANLFIGFVELAVEAADVEMVDPGEAKQFLECGEADSEKRVARHRTEVGPVAV